MKYDYVVVGAGTGGLRLALNLANKGSVAVIEKSVIGGTCLNTGCIPTKAMLYASHLFRHVNDWKDYGIAVNKPKVNFPRLMKRVHSIILEGRSHATKSARKKKNLTIYKGNAHFLNRDTLKVGTKTVSGKKIIIATGSHSMLVPIKGLEKINYMLSDDVINLKKLPKSIIIVGCGYIALEFATFFNDLGAKVTMVEICPAPLNNLDDDVTSLVKEIYEKRGVKILTSTRINEIVQQNDKVAKIENLATGKKGIVRADEMLIATGRVPNTIDLKLENANVKMDQKGCVQVNDYLQTSNSNIYAFGDVIGKMMFAHAAKRSARILLNNLTSVRKQKMNFSLVPWVVFTEPPIAGCGLTEKQAKEQKINYGILRTSFLNNGRARIIERQEGFVKVLFNRKNKKIIGAEIIGTHSDDIIHEFTALMNAGSKIDVLRETIHAHPTVSEVLENLREVKHN